MSVLSSMKRVASGATNMFGLDGRLKITPEGEFMGFILPYSPSTLSLSRSTNWTELPVATRSHARLQFSGGGSDTLSFTFLLDRTDTPSRRLMDPMEVIGFLHGLTLPYKEAAEGFKRPPGLSVVWDEFEFTGVIKEMDVKYLMVSYKGQALRAEVSLTLMGRAFDKACSNQDDLFTAPDPDFITTLLDNQKNLLAAKGKASMGLMLASAVFPAYLML